MRVGLKKTDSGFKLYYSRDSNCECLRIWKKRISDYRGSFQFEITCCLCIKWWTTVLLTVLMRKWGLSTLSIALWALSALYLMVQF